MEKIEQDKDADLIYWLNMSSVLGDRILSSVAIDPSNELSGELSLSNLGINTTQLSDSAGNVYKAGAVIGVRISGGVVGSQYQVVFRMTLDSGETDDRTLRIEIVEK